MKRRDWFERAWLTALMLCCLLTPALSWGGEVPVDSFSPQQAPRGFATVFTVEGKKLKDVQAAEVVPPEGVTVRELRQLDKTKWAVVIFVEESAPPGERSLVLVMKKNRSAPQKIVIPPHSPRISDLTILARSGAHAEVYFSIAVFDEAGDLGDNPRVTSELRCSDATLTMGDPANEVEKKDAQNYLIKHRSSDKVLAAFGQTVTVTGTCSLEVSLEDEAKYRSNILTTAVSF